MFGKGRSIKSVTYDEVRIMDDDARQSEIVPDLRIITTEHPKYQPEGKQVGEFHVTERPGKPI